MFGFVFNILIIISSVSVFFLYTRDLYADFGRLRAEQKDLSQVIADIGSLRDRLESVNAERVKISQEDLDRLANFLPENENAIQMILQIERLADKYGVSIGDLQISSGSNPNSSSAKKKLPEEGALNQDLIDASLSVEFVGNYRNFTETLWAIERNLRLADIKQISISTDEKKEEGLLDKQGKVVGGNRGHLGRYVVNFNIHAIGGMSEK